MPLTVPAEDAPTSHVDMAALLDAAYAIDRLVESEGMHSAAFFVEIEHLRDALHADKSHRDEGE